LLARRLEWLFSSSGNVSPVPSPTVEAGLGSSSDRRFEPLVERRHALRFDHKGI
jgi:hypothetical protein